MYAVMDSADKRQNEDKLRLEAQFRTLIKRVAQNHDRQAFAQLFDHSCPVNRRRWRRHRNRRVQLYRRTHPAHPPLGVTGVAARLLALPAGAPLCRAVRPAAERPAPRRLSPEACWEHPGCYTPYDYQEAAFQHAARLFAAGRDSHQGALYLQMGTGLGKTVVGALVHGRASRGPALVVVPTHAIAEQWLEEYAARYPRLRAALHSNRAGPARPADSLDALVIVVNSLRVQPPEFARGFQLMILDEAHEYCSPVNQRVLQLAQAVPEVLALSATPRERQDGMDALTLLYLGEPVPLEAVSSFRPPPFRGEVRVVQYHAPPEFAAPVLGPNGTTNAILTIGQLVQDEYRLRLVAREVARAARLHEGPEGAAAGLVGGRRHGVLVFAEHRAYLDRIQAALRGLGLESEIEGEGDDAPPGAPAMRSDSTASGMQTQNPTM